MKNLVQRLIFITLFNAIAFVVIGKDKVENNYPSSYIQISGRVLNAQTGSPVKAKIIVEKLPFCSNIIVSGSDGSTGNYQLNILNDIQYSIVVQADGYSTYSDVISINSADESDEEHFTYSFHSWANNENEQTILQAKYIQDLRKFL